jgi:hypothetical protein
MLLSNPLKHCPTYKAEILYADKAVGYVEGQGEVGEIHVPERDAEVLGVAVTGRDAGKHPLGVKLWVDGEWVEYYGDWIAHLSEEVEEEVEEEVDEAVEEEEEDVEEDEEGEDEEEDGEDKEDEAVRWEEDKQADEEANDYTNDYDHDTFME